MSLALDSLAVGRDAFRLGPTTARIEPGQVWALIGPNGGGKTTLLKTLAGLIPALEGAVRTEPGTVVAYLPPPGAVRAGFSAVHLAALGRAARRGWSAGLSPDDYDAARTALARLDVGALADRPFDRLSSGQQQLVLMARLLVQDAAVCLLDEPLALLDPAHAIEIEAAIHALAAEGRVVIASTHALGFAARCDRVMSVGPGGVSIAPPAEALTPERLAALYGLDPEVWRSSRVI